MTNINITLTQQEAELIKKGLEILSEQEDDSYDLCWKLIGWIEAKQNVCSDLKEDLLYIR